MPEKERRSRREAESLEQEQERLEQETSPVRELEDAYADVRDRVCAMFELPEDFKTHVLAARREILLAVRSLIDARLATLDQAEKRREAGRRTGVHGGEWGGKT